MSRQEQKEEQKSPYFDQVHDRKPFLNNIYHKLIDLLSTCECFNDRTVYKDLMSSADCIYDKGTENDEVFHHFDMIQDCEEFTKLYQEKTKKVPSGKIDSVFITKMVQDELQELSEAKDSAEQFDALIDIIYYCIQHMTSTGLDVRPMWKIVHLANMTKFGSDGHLDPQSLKWIKPKNFLPPDDDLRKEIQYQLDHQNEKIQNEKVDKEENSKENSEDDIYEPNELDEEEDIIES